MEILTIVLAGLFSFASGGGTLLDLLVGKNLRSQAIQIEQQAVRLDNTPSYQIVRGKLQKVRVAGRGIELKPDLRIEAIELETDKIDLDRSRLNLDSVQSIRKSLQQPLRGAVRLVLTEADLNRALQSEEIQTQLQQTLNRLVARKAGSTNIVYQLTNPSLELHPSNRLGVKFKLSRSGTRSTRSSELAIALELDVKVLKGKTIQLVEPRGTVNQRPMSSRLLSGFADGISERLDLSVLEADGILARLLQLKINEDKIELAAIALVETKKSELSSIKEENLADHPLSLK